MKLKTGLIVSGTALVLVPAIMVATGFFSGSDSENNTNSINPAVTTESGVESTNSLTAPERSIVQPEGTGNERQQEYHGPAQPSIQGDQPTAPAERTGDDPYMSISTTKKLQ